MMMMMTCQLHRLNVLLRVAFKLGFMVANCLHNQAPSPQYLVDLCQSVSSVASRQHLRSTSRGLLVVPRHGLSSYGRRAFSVAGPAIWNWLSDSLRDPAMSRDSFKRSLKTFSLQLTRVHSELELFGRYALQIYLVSYLLTWLVLMTDNN